MTQALLRAVLFALTALVATALPLLPALLLLAMAVVGSVALDWWLAL